MSQNRVRVQPARRNRQTVQFDREAFLAWFDRAVQAEWRRHSSGASTITGADIGRPADPVLLRAALQALLKGFTDAANTRGGLRLDEHGAPADLDGLLRQGRDNARAGNTQPRLLAKVRSGNVVDLKSAMAALHFFRLVLSRPGLSLDQIGAVESKRLRAVRNVQAALLKVRDGLPLDILQGLFARAGEAAGYASAQDQAKIHYSGFEPFVDTRGVHRMRVRRQYSYRTVRLSEHPGTVQTTLALEWHEWQKVQHMQLAITLLDEQGLPLRELRPPLHKRMDSERGVVVIEVVPDALPDLQPMLAIPAAPQRHHSHEVHWDLSMVCHRADRDIIVSYQPVNGLRIGFTRPPHAPDLLFAVGDSPGLRRTADGWEMDRTLLPREMLAVRFRDAGLPDEQAERLSPSGEWIAPID